MDDQQGDKVTLNHLNKSTTKANDQQGDEVTLSHLNKSATKKWQPKKWTDTKKKINNACPWTKWTDQKKKFWQCMSMNEVDGPKKKKF